MHHPHTVRSSVTEDVEKSANDVISPRSDSLEKRTFSSHSTTVLPLSEPSSLVKWNTRIESLAGLEARGIVRVPPEGRQESSIMAYAQMAILWFSINMSANNVTVPMLGPLVFDLGFVDSVLMATFGCLLGSAGVAYMAIWGAQSGNRTMIVARYFMGYWPAKLTCFLNLIVMVGYGVLDCIIAGQILSAVSGGSMTTVVGIVITALITGVVAIFGMAVFHTYERWAGIPQVIVILILTGVAAKDFDTSVQSTGGSAAVTASGLSFFSLCVANSIGWAGAASDYYVYYPETTSKYLAFLMTLTGEATSLAFLAVIGIGLATGVAVTPSWSAAYNISSGALIVEGYSSLGGFGKFCGVIVALGVIANNIPGTYSAALGCQVMGRYGKMVRRFLWVCAVMLVYLICGIAGRNHLFVIFQNFLALMGYWIVIFISIVLEEHVIFRRDRGFDWSAWENKKYLPVGVAALTAFLIGWAGAIIGMYQEWYVGPVAKLIGDGIGADIGDWLGIGFALLTFPPLRYLELKWVGR